MSSETHPSGSAAYEGGLTDLEGIRVGHAVDPRRPTGVTVVLPEREVMAGVDIRGSAPGTRETALLDPVRSVRRIHALVLSGGSAFGLDAASGVVRFLEERGVGYRTPVARVPIVPSAILFDLALGDASIRPGPELGHRACRDARTGPVPEGNAGVGAGATLGKILGHERAMKGGLGSAAVQVGPVVVAALVAVNAVGDVIDPETGRILAGVRGAGGRGFADTMTVLKERELRAWRLGEGENTTLGVVATNAGFDKAGLTKIAQMAHDGLARTIRPVHMPADGDTLFALSTESVPGQDLGLVGALAAHVTARAVVRAVLQAEPLPGYPCAQGHPTLEISDDSSQQRQRFAFSAGFFRPSRHPGGMSAPAEDEAIFKETPEGFSLNEVQVRLARPDERVKWDRRVRQHHYLGFKRFAGRGLRYVVEWRGKWLALAGWQSGAFKCRHRDRWIGWKPDLQYRRLHLIANNTRFVILASKGVFPALGSWAQARMLRRLGDDWQAHYGHPVLIAESFVDPSRFDGALYRAGNWHYLGDTRGFARHNGRYTDPHGQPKQLYVYPLRRDACRRLRDPRPLPSKWEPKGPSEKPASELRSLVQELAEIKDFRRAQGRKHSVASVLTVYLLARLANLRGPVAAAEYAQKLSQSELEAIGAWKNPQTGRYVPVSKSTLHRVISAVDPDEIEAVLRRFSMPRLQLGRAIAVDGKRIRGANRNGDGHFETATLVEHTTGLPLATLSFNEEGGEIAAVRALLEKVEVAGRVLTVDALHTTRETARVIVETHGADYLMTVKENAPETHELLSTIDWKRDATGFFQEEIDLAHGRIEQRSIQVMTPLEGLLNYPHVAQIFRLTRRRTDARQNGTGQTSREQVYGITSVPADRATPQQLLAWNRGHWAVEVNHHLRDTLFAEDACLARTRFAPANNATCTNIALAIIIHQTSFDSFASATRHFALERKDAFNALLSP